MISIPTFVVKEASRVYGDMTEKVAFNVNIDPTSVLGAFAGGYVANRVQQDMLAKQHVESVEKMQHAQTIENDYFTQVQTILSSLKIVFTPINVIYSVNGQVFEIIHADEMNPDMRNAFMRKDAEYFRDLLVNKMNMEIQLAQQVFAQRLLQNQGELKMASFLDQQDHLLKLAEEEFELAKTAAATGVGSLSLPVSFDSLRPFDSSADFTNPRMMQKVAGLFDYFRHDRDDVIGLDDLKSQVGVGFLPDRVVFLHRGQLLQQLPLLGMSEEGYEAFRRKDKQYFLNYFNHAADAIVARVAERAGEGAAATFEGNLEEKQAASLEEIIQIKNLSPAGREEVDFWKDTDIHPMMYDKILTDTFGTDWSQMAFEALLKQIEVDFHVEVIGDGAINKIGLMSAIMHEKSSVFTTPFTFEKFVRAMNDKSVNLSEFQGNIELEEFVFAMDIAKVCGGPHVFEEFHTTIGDYIAEELFRDNVRFVSKALYDEHSDFERIFYDRVNGMLMRKWKEQDTLGTDDPVEKQHQQRFTEMIYEMGETVLSTYAQYIEMTKPYESVAAILMHFGYLETVPEDERSSVGNAVVTTVSRNVTSAIYLEYRKEELERLSEKWKQEVKPHE